MKSDLEKNTEAALKVELPTIRRIRSPAASATFLRISVLSSQVLPANAPAVVMADMYNTSDIVSSPIWVTFVFSCCRFINVRGLRSRSSGRKSKSRSGQEQPHEVSLPVGLCLIKDPFEVRPRRIKADSERLGHVANALPFHEKQRHFFFCWCESVESAQEFVLRLRRDFRIRYEHRSRGAAMPE